MRYLHSTERRPPGCYVGGEDIETCIDVHVSLSTGPPSGGSSFCGDEEECRVGFMVKETHILPSIYRHFPTPPRKP